MGFTKGVPWYKSWRKRYNNLFVTRLFFKLINNKNIVWAKCKCVCSNICSIRLDHVRSGRVKSCGCAFKVSRKINGKLNTIHGEAAVVTPEYIVLKGMKERCYNPKADSFKYYGGRGIKVYYKWRRKHGYKYFLKWLLSKDGIGRRPNSKYSIDRINVDGNYVPGNIKWSTRTEQQLNKRKILTWQEAHNIVKQKYGVSQCA